MEKPTIERLPKNKQCFHPLISKQKVRTTRTSRMYTPSPLNTSKRKISPEQSFSCKSKKSLDCASGFNSSLEPDASDNMIMVFQGDKPSVFNDNVLAYLDTLPKDAFNHQGVCSLVTSFIQDEAAMDPDRFYAVDKNTLQVTLRDLVYNEETAKKVVDCIPDSILPSQDTCYWGIQFLEDWSMCDQGGDYKHNETCQDVWFDQSVTARRQQKGDPNPPKQDITFRMFNLNKTAVQSIELDTENDEFTFYYHGTNWRSAENILTDGIRLEKGCSGRDFSSNSGFYINEDLQSCELWSRNKTCPAVVVFKTPSDLFMGDDKHLSLTARNQLLERVLRYNRSDCTQDHAVRRDIRDYLTITGPILKNSEDFKRGKKAIFYSGASQTCILDTDFASTFTSYIYGVVYFKRKKF